eukprot:COSAG03_NODE_620_length_6673_cov_121.542440_4_plen_70_part_00
MTQEAESRREAEPARKREKERERERGEGGREGRETWPPSTATHLWDGQISTDRRESRSGGFRGGDWPAH